VSVRKVLRSKSSALPVLVRPEKAEAYDADHVSGRWLSAIAPRDGHSRRVVSFLQDFFFPRTKIFGFGGDAARWVWNPTFR